MKRGVGLVLVGGALPTLLAACGRDDDPVTGSPGTGGNVTTTSVEDAKEQARAVVGDVIDFSLTPDGWEGAFGFVTMKLHSGAFDGKDVHFVRTDTSEQAFATAEKLVFVPKLAPLATEALSGAAYLFDNGASGQPTVFSSEPGRDDYTPAWTLHRVRWSGGGDPRLLRSVAEVRDAERSGALTVERTGIVVNYGMVKWSSGAMPVDNEKKAYLGKGQLLEEPDTTAGRVTFKLSECYPNNRYFVMDHSMKPMAEMTFTGFSPRLQDGPTEAGATGRTNVFMNGVEGPGPMGFQPSVFDFSAGEPAWSPYWDHFAYQWKGTATPKLVSSQRELFALRDAGELHEFPGVPDTKGTVFTVNCPVPVVAPNTFGTS
ncbi:MAG: hypothetical protein KY443_08260 [Actinobacteria bacterium]|nr:hypothetical protein [Actinomycetota bacterium]